MKKDDTFPEPAGAINRGRNRFWFVADLEAYEARNEGLGSEFPNSEPASSADAKVVQVASTTATEQSGFQNNPDSDRAAEPLPSKPPKNEIEPPFPSRQAQRGGPPSPKHELAEDRRAMMIRLAERHAERLGLRIPTGYEVAYQFPKKPPFEMRKKMKEDGWRYVPAQQNWTKVADPKELEVFNAIFLKEGGVQVFKKPVFEKVPGNDR